MSGNGIVADQLRPIEATKVSTMGRGRLTSQSSMGPSPLMPDLGLALGLVWCDGDARDAVPCPPC